MPPTRAPLRKKYHVPALHRAFAILDSLNHTSFGLTVQEISHEHKIPYSTAFYLLETMRECGYAERSEDSKKYRLGHKVLSFREGNAGHYLLDLRTIARPTMEELTEVTGLTTHLAILERDEVVYIEKVEPNGFIRLYTWIDGLPAVRATAPLMIAESYLGLARTRSNRLMLRRCDGPTVRRRRRLALRQCDTRSLRNDFPQNLESVFS
jgi:hypothetical protein